MSSCVIVSATLLLRNDALLILSSLSASAAFAVIPKYLASLYPRSPTSSALFGSVVRDIRPDTVNCSVGHDVPTPTLPLLFTLIV